MNVITTCSTLLFCSRIKPRVSLAARLCTPLNDRDHLDHSLLFFTQLVLHFYTTVVSRFVATIYKPTKFATPCLSSVCFEEYAHGQLYGLRCHAFQLGGVQSYRITRSASGPSQDMMLSLSKAEEALLLESHWLTGNFDSLAVTRSNCFIVCFMPSSERKSSGDTYTYLPGIIRQVR